MASGTSNSSSPTTVLYIAQDDLKERYKNKTERIKRYCASTKTIGSTTHLQVGVNEQPNGTIRIKVEAYPLKSLAKAVQYLIEEFCEVKCQAKYTIHDAHKANSVIDTQKQKQILADGECCPPLSEEALKKHDLETSCELRQFRCPNCYVFWWKTVPKYKPVSTCFRCQLCLNPLGRLQQFGTGRFTCQCNNVFFGKCQGSDRRVCAKCGRSVDKPYIHPQFKMDDFHRLPIAHEQRIHSTTARAATAPRGHYYFPTIFIGNAHNSSPSNYTSGDLPMHPRRHRVCLRDFLNFPALNSHSPLVRNPIANPTTSQPAYYAGVFPSDHPTSSSLEASSITMDSQNTSSYPPDNLPTRGNFMGLDNEFIPTATGNLSAGFQPQAQSASSPQLTNSPGDCRPSQQQSMVTSAEDGKCALDSASSMILASNDTSVDYNPPLTTSISSLTIDFPNREGTGSNSLLDNAQPPPESLSKVVSLPSHTNTSPNVSSQDQSSLQNGVKADPDVSMAISLPTTNTTGPVSMTIPSDQVCTTPDYIPPLTTAIPSCEPPSIQASTLTIDTPPLSSSNGTLDSPPQADVESSSPPQTGVVSGPSLDSSVAVATLASPPLTGVKTIANPLSVNTSTIVTQPLTGVDSSPSPGSLSPVDVLTNPLQTGVDAPPNHGFSQSVGHGTLVSPPKTELNSSPSLSAVVDSLAHEPQTDFDSTFKQSSSSVVTDTVVITAPIDSTPTQQNSSPPGDTLASYPGTCDTLINPPKTETVINTSQSNLQISLNPVTTTTASLPQTNEMNSTPQSAHAVLNISVNVNTTINTASAPMASAEHNVPTGGASQETSRRYWDPRNLKYKQVSTLHDCTGSTESTIVPQLDDRLSDSKFKPHHRAYRQRMPTIDFDCPQDNGTTEEEDSGEEDQ